MTGIRNGLAAAALALSTFAFAQHPPPSTADPDVQRDKRELQEARQDIREDVKDIRQDQAEVKALDAKHADAMRDLNAKEKAAIDAIRDDKSLTPDQKKERIAQLRAQFDSERKALNEKFRADKAVLHKDLKADRKDLRRDERRLRQERRDLRRDAHGKR